MRFRLSFLSALFMVTMTMSAQQSGSVYNFLSLESSAHANALGGKNVSIIEDDASLVLQNPSLLASVSDNSINFNMMTYMKGTTTGSVVFAKTARSRGAWAVAAQFVGYGKMDEMSASGEKLGDLKALDFAASGMYSYCFNDRWTGGATGKIIYSKLGHYSSVGLAVDVALNYYKEESELSLSFVAANMGGQVKAYGDTHERIPFDLRFGLSKGLGHLPLRLSLTMYDLTRWKGTDYYSAGNDPKFGSILMNHFCVGLDVIIAKNYYIAVGYNFRRAYEMKAAGKSGFSGLSLGAGLSIKGFKAGLSYCQYHVSAPSLSFSLGYSF